MEHWKKLFPSNIIEVKYEQMVADHHGTLERVIDFIGLPWNKVIGVVSFWFKY
jgi:hypothetical protein